MINIETRVTETFTVRPTVGGDDDGDEVEAEERERESSEEREEAGPVSPDIYSQRFELDILSSSPPGRTNSRDVGQVTARCIGLARLGTDQSTFCRDVADCVCCIYFSDCNK